MDTEKLREELKDYYGTAAFNGMPQAMIDVSKIENASEEELLDYLDRD